jgi:trehalose 6-phosphate synthase/phosphatase
MADPELGNDNATALRRRLEERLYDQSVDILIGDKVIEVRPRDVHKGRTAHRILAGLGPPQPTILAMGDDETDDDLFAALPEEAITVSVGFRPSRARYRVARPRAARALLASILG